MQPFAFLKDFTAGGTLFAAMIAVVLPSSAEAADLIINGSGSTVSISSGTTSYESITVGESSLATSNTLSISNAATVVNSSSLTIVGNNGALNTLSVTEGAVLNSNVAYLSAVSTSTNNAAVVNGSNSAWHTAAIYLGYAAGGNSLTISNGAVVTGTGGNTALGQFATSSNNTALITGANSRWTISSGAFITGFLGSNNSVTVSNGGLVETGANNLIGFLAGAAGNTVTVTGANSALTSAGISYVGYQGSGALTASNGGQVSSSAFIAGQEAGSAGTIVASGSAGNRGVLSGTSFTKGSGSGTLHLDGGVLKAAGNSGSFVSGFAEGSFTFGAGGGYVDSNGHNIAITSAASGTGGLVKIGSGTLTVSASNSYTGSTTVEAGTLSINGNQSAATGTVTVQSAAALSGTGTIGGDVIIESGGTLLPGATFGTLTINGNLTTTSGALLQMRFGGTSVHLFDQLDVIGNFIAAGTLDLEIDQDYTPEIGDTFTIFGGSLPGIDSGSFTITTNLSGGLFWDTSDLASSGVVSVVPEPSTWMLMGCGAIAIAIFARRRNRRAVGN